MRADLIPIDRDQLKLSRPNYPDNCLALDIAENVRGTVGNIFGKNMKSERKVIMVRSF